ncbi:ABC transporter ATP-binding protein [Roseibium sp.]|uniref:ABC transporter ATP-binding protein n=1 Tax=Roseibium sp. TaxID=1936156 RepID=UPI003B50A7F0
MPSQNSANIALRSIKKTFGETTVIPDLSADVEEGAFTVILGPSGCGKSTLLNMIAGLEDVSSGTIHIGEREVQNLPPNERGLAMVFQNYALYPHMSVGDNIGYSLKIAGVPKADRAKRVAEAARFVSLSDYLDRRPGQLSGGQRQRVAIARAIVREPAVLLFDEPLSNLDAKLRHGMRMELADLHKRIRATSVFVTHDQVEAMTLADRIMILNSGRVEQYATPHEIYHRPASTFVAEFIGAPPMNLLDVVGDGQALKLSDGTQIADVTHLGAATLGIRPEHVSLAADGIPARVTYSEDLGSHAVLLVELPNGSSLRVATQLGQPVTDQTNLNLRFKTEHLHLFDIETGLTLNKADS